VTRVLRCEEVEELLSEHVDGSLDAPTAASVEAHLASCEACPPLLDALREVVAALRGVAVLEPAADLASRSAAAALRAGAPWIRLPRPRLTPPAWLLATAAGIALVVTGTTVLLAREGSSPRRFRMVERTSNAAAYLAERKDRLVEDIRILQVVIGTAFEGRLDRVHDQVDDYRRILEKRRAAESVRKTQGFLENNEPLSLVTALGGAVPDPGPATAVPL